MPPRLLLLGGTGQLGSALCRSAAAGFDVHATSRSPVDRPGRHTLDLLDATATSRVLADVRPDIIVLSAYTMGGPNLQPLTAELPGWLARTTAARLVFVSSDVVFDGTVSGPVYEDHPRNPVHAYGQAKLAAEDAVLAARPDALVVRTSLLWGHPGGGAPERQVRSPSFTFYADEVRCPTHVDDLAPALLEAALGTHTGFLHLAGRDAVDRATFARLLAPHLGVQHAVLGVPQPEGCSRPRHLQLASHHHPGLTGCRERLSPRRRRTTRPS